MTVPNGTSPHEEKIPTPWDETPLMFSAPLTKSCGFQVHLKLENLQPSGSFKSRGVGNYVRRHLERAASLATEKSSARTHFYSSSGGNAGLACVCAAVSLNSQATVIVPLSTSAYMIDKLREAGAVDVIQHGKSWVEANAYLNEEVLPKARKAGENAVFVPPFDAPEVWEGNSTLVHEVAHQLRKTRPASGGRPDLIICSVGGGGLFSGIMQGLNDCGMPDVPVLAVETYGAHSLAESVAKKELVTLDSITSIATSLGARTVATKAFEYAQQANVKTLVLQDRDAVSGCLHLAEKQRILVEAACGVCVAAIMNGRAQNSFPQLNENSNVVVVVCGGSNVSLDLLVQYEKQYA